MITLTDSAAVKVRQLLDAEEAHGMALRVAVRPGGCTDYSYEMYFDGDISADDEKAVFGAPEASVQVVVDVDSAPLLVGATLDFQGDLATGGFLINNPNATSTCGCGSGFSA